MLPQFPELKEISKNVRRRCILDGEIVVLTNGVPDIAKRKDSFYLMWKRTQDWIKFKRMADEDFVVAGYVKKGGHIYSLVLAKYKVDTLIFRGYVTSSVTKEAIDTLEVTGKM